MHATKTIDLKVNDINFKEELLKFKLTTKQVYDSCLMGFFIIAPILILQNYINI